MQTSLLSTSAAAIATQSSAAAKTSATSDMFTKLLVAQIKNQDPTSPTDPSTYVNQLAQLSQTESLQKVADLTSANSSLLQSMQVLALGAQIGSDVMVSSNSVKLGAEPVQGTFTLAAGSTKSTLTLTGVDSIKHEITLGVQPPGDVPFKIDPAALGLMPGTYGMTVETSSGEVPDIQVAGKLVSVKLSASGSVVINVRNIGEVAPSAVTAFTGQATAGSSP